MKIILIICGAAALVVAFFLACSRREPEEPGVLDYDQMILLDAEDLGEGSIASSYRKDVLPVLRQHVATPAEVIEELETVDGWYKVSSQGTTYVIYSPEMDLGEGQNWGNAMFALFDIVNRQLQSSDVKLYAISGGNDLGGMFLTKETYDLAVQSLGRKTDWPYIPTPDPPMYGMQHD